MSTPNDNSPKQKAKETRAANASFREHFRASRSAAQPSPAAVELVCPNCGQWQHETALGFPDCFNACAERGFAPKTKNTGKVDRELVELALAEEKANAEKIEATVQAARASASGSNGKLLDIAIKKYNEVLNQRNTLQAQRDELLADIKAASAILSQPVQFSDTAKLGTMDSATLAERAVYILRSDCGTAREMLKAAIARATSKQGLGGSDAESISTEGGTGQ